MPLLEIRIPLKKSTKRIQVHTNKIIDDSLNSKLSEHHKDDNAPDIKSLAESETNGIHDLEAEFEDEEDTESLDLTWTPLSDYHLPLVRFAITIDEDYQARLKAAKETVKQVLDNYQPFPVAFLGDFFFNHSPETARLCMEPLYYLEQLLVSLCLGLSKAGIQYTPCLPYLTIAELDTTCERARSQIKQYCTLLKTALHETIDTIEIVRRKKVLCSLSLNPNIAPESKVIAEREKLAKRAIPAPVPSTFDQGLGLRPMHEPQKFNKNLLLNGQSIKPRPLRQFTASAANRLMAQYTAMSHHRRATSPIRSIKDELDEIGEQLGSASKPKDLGQPGQRQRTVFL